MDDLITPAERLSPRRDKLADALRYLRTESRTGYCLDGQVKRLPGGLIFKALVEVDNPTARPRPLARRNSPSLSTHDGAAVPLRRAA